MRSNIRGNYQHTIVACFIGYIVQAIVNNFAPLLFITLSIQYGINMEQISAIISINFAIQLGVDFIAPRFVDRIGYKISIMAAHFFGAAGLILFAVLPGIVSNPFAGVLTAVVVYAIGGGLLEVLVSPIMEACPTEKKAAAMSLLHSFYCWGHAGVVILSTLFFALIGIENWKILSCIWAIVPALNFFYFWLVPVPSLEAHGEDSHGIGLIRNKVFWIMMLLMVCAGACEQGVSQWASAFAEKGLGVSKTIGDLAGPLSFAILMGIARIVFSKLSDKVDITKYMLASGVLCLGAYLLVSLSGNPMISLIGCGICGFSVGVLWPGTFSLASEKIKGGTAMFAYLALAGDLGCSGGPAVVGWVAERTGDILQNGILAAAGFPVLLLVGLIWSSRVGRQA